MAFPGMVNCPHCGASITLPGSVTIRELEVLACCMEGMTNKQIAQRLGIAEDTANNHLRHIYAKLGVRDRTQAVVACLHIGLLRV